VRGGDAFYFWKSGSQFSSSRFAIGTQVGMTKIVNRVAILPYI
jgi:hypothetical protein